MTWAGLVALALFVTACSGNVTVDTGQEEDPFETVEPKRPPAPVDYCKDVEIASESDPVRLLTRYEYDNTVRDLLGVDAGLARQMFPPENAADGWENGTDSHVANPLLVRKYLEVSQEVTTRYLEGGTPTELTACASDDVACVDDYVRDFLTRAFRRPPTDDELAIYRQTIVDARAEWGIDGAAEVFVASVLNSPQFLYRVTIPAGQGDVGTPEPVSDWEMASRLSYFVWGSMPDAELFAAAEAGELRTEEQIRTQTERLLDDERSLELVGEFYRQWLEVDSLDTMVKDSAVVEAYDARMAHAWKESLDTFVREIHANDGTLEDLLTANQVYLNEDIKHLYAVDAEIDGMTRIELESRSGLLSQPALMAILAYPNQGSPIHRGIFVREQLLCQHLSAPPDMNLQPPDPDPNATTRERFAQHTEDASCAGCHVLIDPLGFGFENYDAVGRFRQVENGKNVDNSGRLVAMRDPALDGPFHGVDELSQRLATAREVQDCVAQKWVTFALGATPAGDNLCAMQRVQEKFAVEGGSFREMVVAITTSDAFRFSDNPEMTTTAGASE